MPEQSNNPEHSMHLRQRAEARLGGTRKDLTRMAVKDIERVVQELEVHRIELEMQNEELRRAQVELEAVRDRYMDLYDFSPAGHLTLDTHGKIAEANVRAAMLLEVQRQDLIGTPIILFIEPDDQALFEEHCHVAFRTCLRQTCEVRLRKQGDSVRYLHLESLAFEVEPGGVMHCRTALLDVSDYQQAKRELFGRERQLEAVIDSAMDAIITLDDQQQVVLFNRAAEAIFGCAAADALGRPLDRFLPARYREAHPGHLAAFAQSGTAQRSLRGMGELRGLRANGEEFPIEASISRVNVNGRLLLTVILRDISERKAADEALRASDAFSNAIFDSLSSHVCVLDRHGVILKVNEAWTEFAGHNSDRAVAKADVGDNYLDICRKAIVGGDPTVAEILRGIESVLAGSRPYFSTEYACHSPTEQHWFVMRVKVLKGSGAVVISHVDISERVRMARALEDHVVLLGKQRVELESLAGKLLEAQEQERRRIARELHDDFNQRLAALSVELETMEQAAGPDGLPLAQQLTALRGQVGQLSDDLHDMAYRLHPSLLEHVGLEVAARDYVEEFSQRTGLPVQIVARHIPEHLTSEIATNLFRVLQESLQNVFKHAQATRATVSLSGSSKGFGLSVRDNGKGFDPANRTSRAKGLGLLSMQERLRLLGGFFRVHSLAGHGTKICAWVPRNWGDT